MMRSYAALFVLLCSVAALSLPRVCRSERASVVKVEGDSELIGGPSLKTIFEAVRGTVPVLANKETER